MRGRIDPSTFVIYNPCSIFLRRLPNRLIRLNTPLSSVAESIPLFDNTYARLPERFYATLLPTRMPAPMLMQFNSVLSRQLGLDPCIINSDRGAQIFSGGQKLPGSTPLAMAYAGHQFGGFTPQLGDGRAILLGEVIDQEGIRRDIQLKGSGRTPFSRGGDGRATLGPVLREYLLSEAMHALDIPTTRGLAIVLTGETVVRERPLPGAIITRVAQSFVRVGTFQYFAARRDSDALRILADYVIKRHYPELTEAENPYLALVKSVTTKQAHLIAQWMLIGFIHGVMNTDNTQIAGETLDYGPCAFMDSYHPTSVYSSIDHGGRYAYNNQPRIAHWNMACLASALLPLLGEEQETTITEVQAAIADFPVQYEKAWLSGMRKKLGLWHEEPNDATLINDLLHIMDEQRADFTLTFHKLSELPLLCESKDEGILKLFREPSAFEIWAHRWRERLSVDNLSPLARQDLMRRVNPAYIPRNHRVEEAIQDALTGNFSSFNQLLTAVTTPFEIKPEQEHLMLPPLPHQVVKETFCGT